MVLRKIACAFSKAFVRDAFSVKSACITSAPRAASDLEASEEGLRVNARTCQCGSVKKVLATELPCLPVAPVTTISFLAVIFECLLGKPFVRTSSSCWVIRLISKTLVQIPTGAER